MAGLADTAVRVYLIITMTTSTWTWQRTHDTTFTATSGAHQSVLITIWTSSHWHLLLMGPNGKEVGTWDIPLARGWEGAQADAEAWASYTLSVAPESYVEAPGSDPVEPESKTPLFDMLRNRDWGGVRAEVRADLLRARETVKRLLEPDGGSAW